LSTDHDIIQYIPQRHPMVMLSSLNYANQNEVQTCFEIKSDNIFVENGHLMAPGIVENIAQSIAARAGYLARMQHSEVPIGFIGAVQNLEILELPKVGEKIETTILLEHEIFNASIVSGTVRMNEKIIAHCKMKIFINT
jgi:predicted hotdog family 3-hydroxylacyl-ACP dehydratase